MSGMRANVDFEARTITAGVRELVEPARDSARGVGMLPLLRAELGQQVHARYRREREGRMPGFQAEVTVTLTRAIDGFAARVRGRIDGVITDVDSITVEEVKSVALSSRELWQLTPEAVADYNLQARLYALALAETEDTRPETERCERHEIRARLLLVSILDGSQRTMDVEFSAAAASHALDRLLRRAIAEAEAARARAERRMACAAALDFPYPAMRPHQDQLIDDMASGLDGSRPVLAWAPTGIGKTVSALLSGLRFSLGHGKSLFFATAKTTQQDLVARTFEDLVAAADLAADEISAVTLRAKDRMCPPGDLLCHPDVCGYLREFSARAQAREAIAEIMDGRHHITPDDIYAYGERANLCPFELSLRVAGLAELIIGDYNYVYDGGIALAPFSDAARAGSSAVVVDEGHNLLDRARGYHSSFIGKRAIAEVVTRIGAHAYRPPRERRRGGRSARDQLPLADVGSSPADGDRLFAAVTALCARLEQLIDATLAEAIAEQRGFVDSCTPVAGDGEIWCELAEQAVACLLSFALYCRVHKLVFPRDPLPELLREVVRMRDGILCEEPELIPYVAGPRSQDGAGVGILCVNPARRLAARHQRALGTVLMSATLTPLPFYAEVLGFAGMDPVLTAVPSPFPRANRRILIVPDVDTTYRHRGQYTGAIARIIEDIVTARPGRYMAFFSSFAFLGQVRGELRLPPAHVLMQVPAMPQTLRDKTLARLRASPGPMLLMAVTGGVFAEGIDLPGEQLIGAIVVGPSLPPVGFERALMREYHDQRDADGFAYAMLYPGMQRVIQSAGRVIRAMDDRGIIALVGGRFASPDYARLLPPDWYEDSVASLVTHDPRAALADFWTCER